ncbi:hypothetical protein E3P86_02058 [Wallemia ichthyophaga]|uniref:Multifunctional methyltransferase subunit trm112 n=1 Tax=Wallemia ichthyophaga TaxID=245174 RepID=A0A4T0J509_WALIC|nr:hypothetical protein E3P86_02058 [Wallemia ichthyophaga]
MVRLITHNILTCAVKGCVDSGKNYPLTFKNVQGIEIREQEFNADFIRAFFPKLDYGVLKSTLESLGDDSLKLDSVEDIDGQPEDFLRLLHKVLLEMDVTQGEMMCGNCQHKYQINEGIPNMLLGADEI